MRVSTMIRINAAADGALIDRITDFGRQAEARGFPGVLDGPWSAYVRLASGLDGACRGDLQGRPRISVLQLPLRNPVELAHRVQSLQAKSNNRLILGVGSGSTRDDFELLGCDYDHRFRTSRSELEIMSKVWKGEPVNGGTLATWPGCEGGPPILIGAWRSPRWITYAAKQAQGWTPSGRLAASKTSNTA
jgi:hypothetical protein